MLIIALTGGIGSGKSTVVDMFKVYHIPVIDTDIIARQLLSEDVSIQLETISQFGNDILTPSGEINRSRLRQRIFADVKDREKLQAILHPRIHQQALIQVQQQLASTKASYTLIVIPLLTESRQEYPQHRVLLIDSSEALQIERSSRRDHCSSELIKKILATQATREQRQAIADDVITNNDDLSSLQTAVDKLHKLYSALAKEY